MNHKKFSIICFVIFFVFFSKQIYAYQQDIVIKYDNIFSTKILSEEDVYNYQQAYKFQEKCKWKSANNFILKIKNKSLLGHIYAQKFLHPNCYRSKYLELYYWLKKYKEYKKTNNRKFFMIHFSIFLVTFVNLPKNVFYIEEIEVKKLDDRRLL